MARKRKNNYMCITGRGCKLLCKNRFNNGYSFAEFKKYACKYQSKMEFMFLHQQAILRAKQNSYYAGDGIYLIPERLLKEVWSVARQNGEARPNGLNVKNTECPEPLVLSPQRYYDDMILQAKEGRDYIVIAEPGPVVL